MMTARTIEGLYRRLERARELVANGAVYPVAGMDGLYVVRHGDGNAYYLVTPQSSCSCPDFEKHDGKIPCKHMLAVELYQQQQATPPSDAPRRTRPARRGVSAPESELAHPPVDIPLGSLMDAEPESA